MPTIQPVESYSNQTLSDVRQLLRRREADLQALQADVDALRRVEALMSGSSQRPVLRKNPHVEVLQPATPRAGHTNGNSPTVREGIRAALPSMAKPFTAHDMLAHLQSTDFEFKSGNPKVSVRDALYALVEERALKLIQKGTGGKTNIYEKM